MNSVSPCRVSLFLAALSALLCGGCAHTTLTKSSATQESPVHFKKVLVLALVPDDFNRRLVEVAVMEQFTKVPVIAGYQILPDPSELKDKATVLKAIKKSGADGLVVMRLLSVGTSMTPNTTSSHPVDYVMFSDYYYGTAYDVGAYFNTVSTSFDLKKIFNVETRIFDAKTQKLIWSGETQTTRDTTNDHDYRGLMIEVSNVIKSELKNRDLID
jgi:hypothetical protein